MLADRGLDSTPGLDEAIGRGETWLRNELGEQLAKPFERQIRGPLEVFQEAMRFPTEALAAHGAVPVSRDQVTANALPGDVYDLAPASSRDLGEDVWRAHLAWGAAKAAALQQR
ncbi:MAG TPA: hypothetical protein VLB67_07800 [Acidimicrobiia bacterium]|nr:hypothetical protein [Acidimicrobiia bacterium]